MESLLAQGLLALQQLDVLLTCCPPELTQQALTPLENEKYSAMSMASQSDVVYVTTKAKIEVSYYFCIHFKIQ